MLNSKIFRFDLTVEQYYIRDVLRALIHSIIFHRSFNELIPLEVHVDLLNVTYVKIDDPEVEKMIQEKIANFTKSFINNSKQGQILISFKNGKESKAKYWFSKSNEDAIFEQWQINITLIRAKTEREQIDCRKTLSTLLLEKLIEISHITNEDNDHVPAITNADQYPFPFQIEMASNDQNSWKLPWS
ncbi:hypothetical protein HK099_005521 [Clydaea vesicula]|uniref:Autophagy-related protein 101 n=1 Tax=Clydaea vesicula TaxID=447962 RepID=A0AAD5XZJ6_9FUNG|nr:hypothetical protein HK099_005521 [Clydaea vesicula]